MEEAQERTTRLVQNFHYSHIYDNNIIDGSNAVLKAIKKGYPELFLIIQGGVDLHLRKKGLVDLISLNQLGYAIGGLAGR